MHGKGEDMYRFDYEKVDSGIGEYEELIRKPNGSLLYANEVKAAIEKVQSLVTYHMGGLDNGFRDELIKELGL